MGAVSAVSFSKFKTIVRAIGGVWNQPCVHFTRNAQAYTAQYMPNYPQTSDQDQKIWMCHVNGMWVGVPW